MLDDMDKNLAQVTTRVQDSAQKILTGIRGFVFKQNMFALAIAVIIGTSTNNVVQAMIKDLFMPVVNLVIKDQAWVTWGPVISMIDVADLDSEGKMQYLDGDNNPVPAGKHGLPAVKGAHLKTKQVPNKLLIGDMVWQFMNLLVIGVVAYFMSKYLMRQSPLGPPTKPCPSCLEQVNVAAKVCKYCTRDLPQT